MAAYATGANWSFPEDIPGGWVNVDHNDDLTPSPSPSSAHEVKSEPTPTSHQQPKPTSPDSNTANTSNSRKRKRTTYPPRQCRICLDTIYPTFATTPENDPLSTSLPASFQPTPEVTYTSPPGQGGRLLRPCHCRGTQKYVHEECLSAWRFADPLQKRNYWQCPTCSYKYKLRRLTWGSWIASPVAQVALTLGVFLAAVGVLGFVADPIINLYLDPGYIVWHGGRGLTDPILSDGPSTWTEHFVKGLASLGLLGFAKFLLTLSPWHWFNMRGGFGGGGWGGGGGGMVFGGGGGSRGHATGRDRLNQLSWVAVLVGVATFLYAVWKGVRAWSRKTLEKAGERVMDVPGGEDDEEEILEEDVKEDDSGQDTSQ